MQWTHDAAVTRRRTAVVVAIAAVVVGLGALTLWLLPTWLSRSYHGDARGKAVGDARTASVAFLVASGAVITVLFTARTYRLTREGQVTDRYGKAVGQLGEDGPSKSMVRLGGIYALERLASDSIRDQPTIVQVLSAFIRQQQPPDRDVQGVYQPKQDALIAAQVLGRLPERNTSRGLLSHAHLQGFYLHRLNLRGVDLFHAHLGEADLGFTRLDDAVLRDADMRGCNLIGTSLRGADLTRANLENAITYLPEAVEARKQGTCLQGALLHDARLHGANLRLAKGLTQEQVNAADGDDRTVLPDGVRPPQAWRQAPLPGDPDSGEAAR